MTKWTARLGLAGVSLIAGVVSYFHALAVVQATGATAPVSYLVPFLADLVILSASAALLGSPARRPPLAMVALAAGIGVTLAMNVAAGWAHGLAGALVAGWPAVAFILALESLGSILRPRPAADGGHREPLTIDAALALLLTTGSQRKLAGFLGVPRSRIAEWANRPATVAGHAPKENSDGQERQPRRAQGQVAAGPPAGAALPTAVPAGSNGHGGPHGV